MSEQTTSPLIDLKVLVTRPEDQAKAFCSLLANYGATAIPLPAIRILPLSIDPDMFTLPAEKPRHYAVFISCNAVTQARPWLGKLPRGVRFVAIGRKTAKALQSLGINVDLVPREGFTSEALLALPELQKLDDAHFILFRGAGGREHLARTLTERGATVTSLALYQRVKPDIELTELENKLVTASPDVVTITSVETLRNFLAMTDKLPSFAARALPVIAGSKRIGTAVAEAGFGPTPVIANDPTDQSMLQALLRWKQQETLQS
jgi:uroporphyrinogen-III synthase